MNVQKLIEDNMNLVYFVIHKYYPTFYQDEDIIQIGMVGLCYAANTFDESKGFKFSSFASKCILNEINMEFRRRKKQKGVLSLELNCYHDDGETKTLGECLVGDEDVDVNFFDCDKFYSKLDQKDREIVDLRRLGFKEKEIAEKLNVSRSLVSTRLGRLRHVWRKLYGN